MPAGLVKGRTGKMWSTLESLAGKGSGASTPPPTPAASGRYRPAVELSRRRFEELVSEALDAIPEELAALMDNVAVIVEDRPTDEQRGHHDSLFGIYEGTDLTERSLSDYTMVMPDRITIFRLPLCEACDTEDDLYEEILVTVVHEVAHHFGISDERLEELGWD